MLIQRWIDENEPGHGNGWEPYPTSLRIVNWIKWSLAGNHLEKDWLLSLSLQVRYLTKNLETHLLGNHLFANAKALCFAGLFFDEGESDVWYRTGLQLIEREVIEQLCDDGGNFELSTMYHAIFLEDLLDLVNIHNAYNKDVPAGVENSIIPMLNWLHVMCHPDGEISFFNDAAHGIAPVVAELADYARRLGFVLQPVTGPLIDLPSSGYSRIEQVDVVAIIDRAAVGPDYLPGHAHADTLSFELSLFGERIVVNSGISVYGVGEQRMSERSTASHSTVFIDGQDSSEVWDGFRVARRANICKRFNFQNENSIRLIGCHDGYNRIKGKPQHCREWLFQVNSLEIIDRIGGAGVHEIVAVFPLHPDVVLQDEQDNRCTLYVKGKRIAVEFEGNGALDVLESSYHPQLGVSLDNLHLHYKVERELPIKITTRISW